MSLTGFIFGLFLGITLSGNLFIGLLGGFLGFFLENSIMRFLPGSRGSQDNNNFLVPLFSLFAKAAKETGGPTTRQLQFVNLLFRSQFFLGWRSQDTAVRAFEAALEDEKSTEDWINTISAFPLDGFRKHWLIQTTAQLLSLETGRLSPRGQEILTYLASQLGFGYRFSTAGSQGGYQRNYQSRPQFSNPREVLGLSPQASAAEIKKQYRQLAKEFHPDHFQNLPENDPKRLEAQEKFLKIQNAYDELKTELAF
jgi:DnaJ like chaperone protein